MGPPGPGISFLQEAAATAGRNTTVNVDHPADSMPQVAETTDLVVLHHPDTAASRLLADLRTLGMEFAVVMMDPAGGTESRLRAIRRGANGYAPPPMIYTRS